MKETEILIPPQEFFKIYDDFTTEYHNNVIPEYAENHKKMDGNDVTKCGSENFNSCEIIRNS